MAMIYEGQAPYSADLSCYSCIQNDYIYCHQGGEHQTIAKTDVPPSGICCDSFSNCPQASDPSYTCSSEFADKLLSLYMCPFKQGSCGATSDIVFAKSG
jgi:hypothetical protein